MKARLAVLLVVTLASAARAGDFEFAVIGDTRPRFESESFRPFEGLITSLNAFKPALVINLGDLIYGYGPASKEKQWDKYQAVIKTIRVPYYQLPGNHDTHSKEARAIYGQRFGKFYRSFDYGDCHFVLLDNTEQERWGYLGPTQLAWLTNDLRQTRARAVFVFLHFPVWEPERVTPEYYEFWANTLHPLFKQSRVRAVFAGHYHAYGPTREFDGIRYFITGGGGAELRPEYKKSGGEYHFMMIHVTGDRFDVRVVTEHGELTDPEADVMGGLQFADRNVSRIGIQRNTQDLKTGVPLTVSVANPDPETLTGQAEWVVDASAFSVQPQRVLLQIPGEGTGQYHFTLKALQDTVALQSLPRLEFNVVSGGTRRQFRREVRFLQELNTPWRETAPVLDGRLADWSNVPALELDEGSAPGAALQSGYDAQNLYLALTVPAFETAEAKELGFSDEVQIGMARRLSDTDFSSDLLRLGFNSGTPEAVDRTPGPKTGAVLPGAKSVCRTEGQQTIYEITIPLRLLKNLKAGAGSRLVLDLSFPVPGSGTGTNEPPDPGVNTFSYRIRYGSDSLVPVHFVELNLERQR
ncbi:MAG TPA: metallophosphoesterase [Verrucomicrobiae bacterium]|nr:metallophosphoesterase [Verrucomicrobiae bacterium]